MTTPNEEPNEETTTEEVVTTPVGNPDNAAEGTGAVSAPPSNGTNGEKELSAYKKRLQELGREGIGAEIPLELADMMRAAAKQQGDIALTHWIRLAFAEKVNASNLTHEVDGQQQPWTFDLKKLEETKARTSTRNLTPEQKAEKAKADKEAAVDQRALVKRLLAEHRAKVMGQAAPN